MNDYNVRDALKPTPSEQACALPETPAINITVILDTFGGKPPCDSQHSQSPSAGNHDNDEREAVSHNPDDELVAKLLSILESKGISADEALGSPYDQDPDKGNKPPFDNDEDEDGKDRPK
jgi:hypothetical protein